MNSNSNSLRIPDAGVLFAASGSEPGSIPPQAFYIRLDTSTIESIIQSHYSGEDIRLALGKTPTLQYGSKSHRISPPTDSADYDLYLTKPFESTRRADQIPTATSLFQKLKPTTKSRPATTESDAEPKIKSSASSKGSTSSGLDSDIETLQNGLAAHDAARERARVVGKLPSSNKASTKTKTRLPSSYGSKTSSLPTSPGLNAVQSPSLNPTLSASQQAMERAKEQRFTLVHELAVQDYTLDYLKGKWEAKESEFRPTLEKVAEYNSGAEKWTLRKTYWKELDVWNYDYSSQDERQMAIDNAVKHYDKQRMSSSEPEWQRLLPRDERGKGKCLSRLQANLAKVHAPPPAPAAAPVPKIKVQKTEDGSMSGDGLESDRPKAGGEKMSRSSSNPLPAKSKKASGQEAQAKRLLGTSKAKSAAQKASPTKPKAAGSKANGGRILSQEIIVNSDTSGDEAPAPMPKPKPKPKAASTKTKDTVIVAGRPPAKAPPKSAPVKRPREDDDSSSSSGTPLSKRIKQKQPLPASKLKHRPSDASVNSSRGTAGSSTFKSKNTSPTKSSPLASSPPTNASDLENDIRRPALPKKRKLDTESRPLAAAKRRAADVPAEILGKANKFKAYYQQYEALHHEISALDNPPDSKLADLLDMRGRLENMKKEIYRECSPV
ncbi:hypothetical protein PT974_06201 [Cladobotryum mycophilum]|uniref:RING-type E3 ubiquitin transferase n=1 Tax=Cladobotryum mycophilum TaxID=491253 RepID=A0ABR0SKW4_9HYPO